MCLPSQWSLWGTTTRTNTGLQEIHGKSDSHVLAMVHSTTMKHKCNLLNYRDSHDMQHTAKSTIYCFTVQPVLPNLSMYTMGRLQSIAGWKNQNRIQLWCRHTGPQTTAGCLRRWSEPHIIPLLHPALRRPVLCDGARGPEFANKGYFKIKYGVCGVVSNAFLYERTL